MDDSKLERTKQAQLKFIELTRHHQLPLNKTHYLLVCFKFSFSFLQLHTWIFVDSSNIYCTFSFCQPNPNFTNRAVASSPLWRFSCMPEQSPISCDRVNQQFMLPTSIIWNQIRLFKAIIDENIASQSYVKIGLRQIVGQGNLYTRIINW